MLGPYTDECLVHISCHLNFECHYYTARGMSLRKVSYKAFVFSLFWRNQEKGEATDLAASQLLGSWLWGSTRVSALTGSELSATQWLRRCKALQHSSGIERGFEPKTPDSLWSVLTTKPLVRINGLEKNGIWLAVFHHLQLQLEVELIFLRTELQFLDFSSWISRPENSWMQTFDWYIL